MRSTSVTLAAALLLAAACGMQPLELGDADEYRTLFDLAWLTYDQEYVGFEWRGVDWQEQYQIYVERADTVTSMAGLAEVLQEMLTPLQDHQIFINVMDTLYYQTYYLPPPEPNHNWDALWAAYLEPAGFQWFSENDWGWCVLDSMIPYFLIRDWNGDIYPHDMDEVMEAYADAPAMIVDVRPSLNHTTTHVRQIIRRFNDELRLGFYYAWRNGPDHDDVYLEPFDIFAYPGHFEGPVAVLTGENWSAPSELFALMGKQIPQVTLIGDTTRGSVSTNVAFELPGGFFSVPWYTVVLPDTSDMLQCRGVYPDILVEYEYDETGVYGDNVLEYAIEWAESR